MRTAQEYCDTLHIEKCSCNSQNKSSCEHLSFVFISHTHSVVMLCLVSICLVSMCCVSMFCEHLSGQHVLCEHLSCHSQHVLCEPIL